KEIKATVASLRLDAVAAEGFGMSRTKMVREIKAERVKLNWQPVSNPALAVKEGDVLSLRGRGRVVVAQVVGTTRKGRTSVVLQRYSEEVAKMLKRMDIQNLEFKRVFKGYDPEEVDDFLADIVVKYEEVYQENRKLRQELEELRRQLESTGGREQDVLDLLASAKQTVQEIKSMANREADNVISLAQAEAERIISEARLKAQ